jgi:phosphoribosylformylglycinamidine synthase subunit PurSL
MRIEVFYKKPEEDGRTARLKNMLAASGHMVDAITVIDVYILENGPEMDASKAARLFSDKIAQSIQYPAGAQNGFAADRFVWDVCIEVAYKPGVTDPLGISARQTVEIDFGMPKESGMTVRTARQYLLSISGPAGSGEAAAKELYNPLIQDASVIDRDRWNAGSRPPEHYETAVPPGRVEVETFQLAGRGDAELTALSKVRLLALSLEEMQAVRDYYTRGDVREERRKRGLPPDEATDVELEMIAQTWSEHCKHKIFAADIEYKDTASAGKAEKISSLFNTYIKGVTEKVAEKKQFLRSVFHDNSGVVQFHDDYCLCFKVETHNSPSALDPYGGAITGIVGVNRDILGTGKGAKPIFNTNVLCFGEPDMPKDRLPEGLLHPRKIMYGVHQGIIDGGNQSGIPVAAGAFLFDDSYTGKPLVFCGTGGILPAEVLGEASWIKHIDPGDKAVMVGGRIGKDGIHGATFSSQELNEESPTSAVQIGDPIIQKKMTDFLLEARDLGLYKGITDNGAGGLSSSFGEMAEYSGGVRIELDKCPLKYPGLAPWEIFVSESQERMSLAVSEETIDRLLALAEKRDVEAAVIGEFTDTGYIDLIYHDTAVGFLSLDFLHNGLPVMKLRAEWTPPARGISPPPGKTAALSGKELFFSILGEPNVASKEGLVRQYDHEVQAGSIVKPFCGVRGDGPSDGGVLKPGYGWSQGVTVTHGICPRYGDVDTYHMAVCAVDEALRAHVALGGDPERACALDNFCWPDPVESEQTPDGRYKCAQLVRACKGLYDACSAYGLPLISGKDSMKNDARIGNTKVSIRPTLLISLLGLVPDINGVMTTDFKREGDVLFVLGETRVELGGTIFEKCTGLRHPEVPKADTASAFSLYKQLYQAISRNLVQSCHDCSDGGLGIAVTESAIGGNCGIEIDMAEIPGGAAPGIDDTALLYSESPSRFVVSVAPENREEFAEMFRGHPCGMAGRVTGDGMVRIFRGTRELISVETGEAAGVWKG